MAFPTVAAQDVDQPNTANSEDVNESEIPEQQDPDPFAVPEGANAMELFRYIQHVKREFGRSRETVKQAAGAAVEAADLIRKSDDLDLDQEKRAIAEQMQALQLLARLRSGAKKADVTIDRRTDRR